MNKNQQISAMLLAAIAANGGDVAKGFDSIFGEGAYKAFAGSIYHELRAKQGL